MNRILFAKTHFNKAMLEEQVAGSFCANQQILSSRDYPVMLSCFENMIRKAFYNRNKIISLLMCQQLQRQDNFIIPIGRSVF